MALLDHIEVKLDSGLIRLDRAHGGVRGNRRFLQHSEVASRLAARRCRVPTVRLHELGCSARPQPELLSDVRVQIARLLVHHAEQDDLSFVLGQRFFRVFRTIGVALSFREIVDLLYLGAGDLALFVHAHGLETALDAHLVVFDERDQLARLFKLIDTLGAREFIVLVLDSVHVLQLAVVLQCCFLVLWHFLGGSAARHPSHGRLG